MCLVAPVTLLVQFQKVLAWISGSGVSAFIFGFLADVIGRRKVMVLSQALYFASWFIIGFAPSLTWHGFHC